MSQTYQTINNSAGLVSVSFYAVKKGRVMEHPAFADAGASPGLEIWTIDKFEPVPVDSKTYGKFYNGDSYIILKTTGRSDSALSYDAHFWLGAKTTQDKKGSAAILTVTLDDMLGGKAVQHREVQGHESSQFLGYFQPAIRYLEGGNESGFNEVETNAGAEKRLLRLSGCDNMRIDEVPADASSLTKENCFILEVEHDIFVLMPEGAKATQRRKIISVANQLRFEEHNGRATIEIIDEFSDDDDVALFFNALGSGSKDDIQDDDASEGYSRADINAVYLYKVLVGDDLDLVALNKPFKQKQLASDEVYILDTPCSGIYIWLGDDVDGETKKNYYDIVQKYLDAKGYPAWVHVTRVAEGVECSNFKQYFHNWDTVNSGYSVKGMMSDADAGYYSGDAEESAAAAKQIGKSASARGYMPDQGEGSLTVTRFAGDQEDVTERFESGLSLLYQSEVYVVKYQYTNDSGEDAYVLYLWIGADASSQDKTSAYELTSDLEQELDNVTVVKVPQGKEPKHFLSIFKGDLAIVFGGKDEDYKATNSKKSYDDDKIRLFRVEGTELGVDMRACQVEESGSVLEDDDVFVLETADKVYVWSGKESIPSEAEAAQKFVLKVVGDEKEVEQVEQGSEPDEFWDALGGAPDEKEDASGWKLNYNRRVTAPRNLTAVTVTVTGKVKFEELPLEFKQEDLSDDGVYVLDTGEELYLWQGANIPERVKAVRSNIIKEYIDDDGLDRTVDSAVVISVKQGNEPAVFRKLFPDWDPDMWSNQTSYDDLKDDAKSANS
ncbi:gelsolin-like isoform X1 [Amyelois transitella]|uniref:gelsolin-like isoform X1 n=1 Tax=Amyelois transitella TaxID=680683 RepID=UPI0029903459|nr:gelsolin-like isoform X1 [Amyelois transitella]